MKEELADYSVDRLGKFDFALHSVGKLLSVSCCTFSICHVCMFLLILNHFKESTLVLLAIKTFHVCVCVPYLSHSFTRQS